MKRFLIVKLFEMVDSHDAAFRDVGEESVHEEDTYEDADNWVELQSDPDSYLIRDRYADDVENEEEEIDLFNFSSPFATTLLQVEYNEDDWSDEPEDEEYMSWAD